MANLISLPRPMPPRRTASGHRSTILPFGPIQVWAAIHDLDGLEAPAVFPDRIEDRAADEGKVTIDVRAIVAPGFAC